MVPDQPETHSEQPPDAVPEAGTPFSEVLGAADDIPGSAPKYDYLRMGAGVVIGLALVAIVLFSVTDLSSVLLPMDDAYLGVLVPKTEDGSPPFILNTLSHELEGNSLSVTGTMTNNSTEDLESVLAVVSVEETTGRFPATLEVPVDPSPLPAGEEGTFRSSVTLPQKPDQYSVRFKLKDGPFVPHLDARFGGGLTPVPDGSEPIRLTIPQ